MDYYVSERAKILAIAPGLWPLSGPQIAVLSGVKLVTVKVELVRMKKRNLIDRVGWGMYALPEPPRPMVAADIGL